MLPAPPQPNPPPVLKIKGFEGPGSLHGFSTRHGGIPHGGSPAAVLPAFLPAAGFPPASVAVPLHQVHGHAVHMVGQSSGQEPEPTADGAVTDRPGVVLMVRTADCVPILLVSDRPGVAGVAHAGWRGALAGIIEETVEGMVSLGASRPSIRAAVGPAIGPCCFTVGPEVAKPFAGLSRDLVDEDDDGPRVDLPGAVGMLLEGAGLAPSAIHRLSACTACRQDLFFSHRGEAGRTGRLLAAVGLA
jgi:YfiH family protein